MDKLTKKGLDGTQLKTIALVLMVLDHIHYFFEFTGCIPTVFSMLGRLSAPLFLFCTVEGFAHTHDRRRYFIRIWAIGAAMAALEFFMIYAKAFRRGDGFYPLNAIFQDLALLCIVWQGIDWLREKKLAKGIAAIAAVLCWPYVVVVFLLLFPGVQKMPIASTVVAFVITSPLPMWTAITDGGWSFLLGGALLSTFIFGFPVFCLVCPIGLTFATILLLVNLFAQGDVTWSLIVVPAILIAEVLLFKKWCHKLCPLSAFMSLIAKLNRTFKPTIDNTKCLETAQGKKCGACGRACDEGIDPRHPELSEAAWSECTKCRSCMDACPAHAISMPLIAKKGEPVSLKGNDE